METLKKGTKILMKLKSDWLKDRIKVDGDGVIPSVDNPLFVSVIKMDVPILRSYKNKDYRFVYEKDELTYISDRITKFHKFYKKELVVDLEVDNLMQEIRKLLGIEKGFSSAIKPDEEIWDCIVTTEDGEDYCFEILQ